MHSIELPLVDQSHQLCPSCGASLMWEFTRFADGTAIPATWLVPLKCPCGWMGMSARAKAQNA